MARDKFAAMASRNAAESAERAQESNATPIEPPRRDKLAAMASRSAAVPSVAPSGGRGNKFAAMTANVPKELPYGQRKDDHVLANEQQGNEIKERLSKRSKILENLNRAEDLTCKLLEIAHQTTKALEDLSCAPDISELSRTYRETIRELHPLLSTDTEDLVQPYQNHTRETKQSMYAARVEMRLAKERTKVLKIITELEKKQRQSQDDATESESKKRPRE